MYDKEFGSERTALVVGASGIAGSELAQCLSRQDWKVHGLSRGYVKAFGRIHQVHASLEDRVALEEQLAGIRPTHVFYTAWKRHDTERENVRVNGLMVRNLMDVLRAKESVRHVALLTGLKHYIGPPHVQGRVPTADTPFAEDTPRLSQDNFYYAQEDEVFDAAARDGFTWSVHRAHTIIGHSVGNAMNMGLTIAAAAALSRELGRPLVFPGSEIRWNGLGDMTDAGLLSRHMIWAATTEKAANEAYNVVNGDVFRWRSMWPKLAAMLDVDWAPFDTSPQPFAEQFVDAEAIWSRIAERYRLIESDLNRVASWWHTDTDLGRGMEMLADMSKSRLAGFADYVRTEDAFQELFVKYRETQVIP